MAEHKCRACIVYCMDFRLHEQLNNFFEDQKLDGDGADVIRVAGAIKSLSRPKEARDREFLLEQLKVAYELHGVRQLYLINHEDCGAYGLEDVVDTPEELAIHLEDLRVAGALLKDRFPDTEVSTYFMRLDGKAEHLV